MTDDSAITELDDRTVERIAAGEVVERPASVVKELLENAIDAGADRVEVAVEAGGTERIEVRDDGRGMTEADLRQAVREHTTSKIDDVEDLEAGVGTLGFRGEALHAIGAVSRSTITSCPRDQSARSPGEATGTELSLEGGEVTDVSPAGRPPGTTVTVTDLFFNVPARRKYLKTETTESGHINRVVASYALANPEVAVILVHDDREIFATTGTGDRQAAVMAIYGREVAASMVPVDPGDLPAGPLDGVTGLVSHPETNRASREYLSTFVNGRYVTAGAVREAILDAYGSQLGPDRYPFAVLDIDLDPGTVDVNVHPRKLDVRFAEESAVKDQVEAAVHAALSREGLVRTRAPRGRSAPEETAVAPESPSHASDGDDRATGTSSVPPDSGDADSSVAGARSPADSPTSSPPSSAAPPGSPATSEERSTTASDAQPSTSSTSSSSTSSSSTGPAERTSLGRGEGEEGATNPHRRKFGPDASQAGLGEAAGPAERAVAFDTLPAMRLLGQYQETYLVAETEDGLVLVDQHAADERVNYERLRESVEGEVTTQALARPVEVPVTAGEAAVADTHREALARLGFRLGPVEDGRVEVRTVPDLVGDAADPSLLRDVLADLLADAGDAAATVEAAADELLADLACYPSVTANTSLAEGSSLALLERLDDCENPWACPHGRPTVIVLEDDEIEARFERDYPGH